MSPGHVGAGGAIARAVGVVRAIWTAIGEKPLASWAVAVGAVVVAVAELLPVPWGALGRDHSSVEQRWKRGGEACLISWCNVED